MNHKAAQPNDETYNQLCEVGFTILDPFILLADQPSRKVGFFAKRKLKKAIAAFEQAIVLQPQNFVAYWGLGKTYQALDYPDQTLASFERAYTCEKSNADVCREACLAAMECGDFLKGNDYADKAIAISEDDPGHYCNKALALMFLGKDKEALESVSHSLRLAPQDEITQYVNGIILSVAQGKVDRPTTMAECQQIEFVGSPSLESNVCDFNISQVLIAGEGWKRFDGNEVQEHYQNQEGFYVSVLLYFNPPIVPAKWDAKLFRGSLKQQMDGMDKAIVKKRLKSHGYVFIEVEIETCMVGGFKGYRTIMAIPNEEQEYGLTFIGTFTIPLKSACFEVKCVYCEDGLTGARETVIMAKEDCRDNFYTEKYDRDFPGHPLTLVRKTMNEVYEHINVEIDHVHSFYG